MTSTVRMTLMVGVPMEVPVIIGRMDVIVTACIRISRGRPKTPAVRNEIVNRFARESDHAVKHGEIDRGQIAQPVS
jgi:hypothetical protein